MIIKPPQALQVYSKDVPAVEVEKKVSSFYRKCRLGDGALITNETRARRHKSDKKHQRQDTWNT